MASNPMQQFSVHKIGPEIKIAGVDLSFTNASLFMVISASIILLFLFLGTKEKKLFQIKFSLIAEMFYTFVAKMISDTAGSKAKPYFPFIFSLFMFVLFCNMVGMLPYSFTVTSHIIVTLIMALFIFIAVTIIGFLKHGFKYLSIFVPSGVPTVLLPLITVIEIISYLSRPVSLSVRLFANMMAGHTMLKVFGGFVISLGLLRWVVTAWFFNCINRIGDFSSISTSLCFCNFNLYLFERCIKFTSLINKGGKNGVRSSKNDWSGSRCNRISRSWCRYRNYFW